MADTATNMADYSAPFDATSDTSPPWGALTSALAANGVLIKSDDGDPEVRDCKNCADLLLPPTTSADNDGDDNDGGGGGGGGGDIPLLLVLISGSWCAPCKNFTPVLSSVNNTLATANITVVFLSADADLPAFDKYYATMPTNWRALPYGEDSAEGMGEDDRDDLMECLGAASLPTLVVLDPLNTSTAGSSANSNKVVVPNAVREVQAAGEAGMEKLIGRWKAMAAANRRDGGGTAAAAGGAKAARPESEVEPHETHEPHGDESESLVLRYSLPDSSPALLCQYFRTQLLSSRLPPSLSAIILRREDLTDGDDVAALEMAEGLRTNNTGDDGGGGGGGEMWAFRTAAPALPLGGWGGTLGGSFGLEAGAIACWEIGRDGNVGSNGDDDDENSISRAVVTIENETGRYLLVFRETIVMERPSSNSSSGDATTGGCEVTKTLNLDGVPSVARAAFARRWRKESEAIFHALLGTCDRRKMVGGSGGTFSGG